MTGFQGFEELNARFLEALDSMEVSRTQGFITDLLDAIQTEAATMTPVDTSNLINSAFARSWRSTSGWYGEVGYGAEYAAWVHEKPGTLMGTPFAWNPDAEPKFLEKAVRTVLAEDMDAIIERQYSI